MARLGKARRGKGAMRKGEDEATQGGKIEIVCERTDGPNEFVVDSEIREAVAELRVDWSIVFED